MIAFCIVLFILIVLLGIIVSESNSKSNKAINRMEYLIRKLEDKIKVHEEEIEQDKHTFEFDFIFNPEKGVYDKFTTNCSRYVGLQITESKNLSATLRSLAAAIDKVNKEGEAFRKKYPNCALLSPYRNTVN